MNCKQQCQGSEVTIKALNNLHSQRRFRGNEEKQYTGTERPFGVSAVYQIDHEVDRCGNQKLNHTQMSLSPHNFIKRYDYPLCEVT